MCLVYLTQDDLWLLSSGAVLSLPVELMELSMCGGRLQVAEPPVVYSSRKNNFPLRFVLCI